MHRPYINKEDRKENGAKYRNYNESVHHIVATSIGWANINENKIHLFDNLHIAHHRVYGNLPPHKQIEQRLKINGKVLSPSIYEHIQDILANDDKYRYKDWVRVRK